jgi:hypothetical protein
MVLSFVQFVNAKPLLPTRFPIFCRDKFPQTELKCLNDEQRLAMLSESDDEVEDEVVHVHPKELPTFQLF